MNAIIRAHVGTRIIDGSVVVGCADCEKVITVPYRNYAENAFFDMYTGLAVLEMLGHSVAEHQRPSDDVSVSENWPA